MPAYLYLEAGAVSGFLPGGGGNLPGGGQKIARYPLSLSGFCFSTHYKFRTLFDISDRYYKEIHKIYTLQFFHVRLLLFIHWGLDPSDVLGSGGGAKTPGNGQIATRLKSPLPRKIIVQQTYTHMHWKHCSLHILKLLIWIINYLLQIFLVIRIYRNEFALLIYSSELYCMQDDQHIHFISKD